MYMSNLEYIGSDSFRSKQNGIVVVLVLVLVLVVVVVVVGEWNNRRRN